MVNWEKLLTKKKDAELDEIISDYKNSFSDVLEALTKELKRRNYKTEELSEIEKEIKDRRKIKKVVKETAIKTKASIKWTPKYTAEFQTQLPKKLAINTVTRGIIALGWYIVHIEDDSIEAKRPNDWGDISEKIIVSVKNNLISVSSYSIKNNICDFGKNSRRVGEFIISYKAIESSYDKEEISEKLNEITQKEEDSKYKIPNELTKPKRFKEKNINFLLGGSLLLSLGLGALLALCASLVYIIFLYDFLIGLVTALALGYLIRLSNISDFIVLRWIGFSSIGLTYFLSHIFRFLHIVNTNNITDASLIDYLSAKLDQGLQYKDSNFGIIGLIIAWIVEIVIALVYYNFKIAHKVIQFDLDNAPEDVVDFAIYWFNEGKNEDEVKKELSKKGWYEKEQQDLIINAVGARCSIQELERS